jgi:hypothetical protein
MKDVPATAGQVRTKGKVVMPAEVLTRRKEGLYTGLASATLIVALVIPHAGLPVRGPGWGENVLVFFLSIIALQLVWDPIPRTVRGELVAFGGLLGVLFFGLTDGLGLQNAVVGWVMIALALGGVFVAMRARPSYGTEPTALERLGALVLLMSTTWALIMAILAVRLFLTA